MSTKHGKQTMWSHLTDKPSTNDLQCEYGSANVEEDHTYGRAHGGGHDANLPPMVSRQEIWSWYLVDCGSTPVFIVLVAMIFPVLCSILATQYGCTHNTPHGCDYNNDPILSDESVFVFVAGSKYKPESFATLMIAVSGGLQCVAFLLVSAVADYQTYQNVLFRVCTTIGCLAMICCVFFNAPEHYLAFGLWGALLLVPYGLSVIFYNAFLPVLVDNHWSIRRLRRAQKPRQRQQNQEEEEEDTEEDTDEEYKTLLQSTQDGMSQCGICVGFIGGLFATVVAAVILLVFEDVTTFISDHYEMPSSVGRHQEEYWMTEVVAVHVWHSQLQISSMGIDTNDSFIHGMQFVYAQQQQQQLSELYGSVHGVNSLSPEEAVNISMDLMHSRFDVNVEDGDYINQVILYQSNASSGLTFLTAQSASFTVGDSGVSLSSPSEQQIVIRSDGYPQDSLAGYATSTSNYSISSASLSSTVPILSGFSFAFMDNGKGQFGNHYDTLGVYVFIGAWSLLCSLPAMFWLKTRAKEPLPENTSIFTVSVKSYWNTIRTATKYPNLLRLLIAWFIFSDAENTISAIAVLFAQNELNMNGMQLIVLLLEIQLLASMGNMFFLWLQKRFHLSSKHLLLIHLSVNCLTPLWACLGLIDGSKVGLRTVAEFYIISGLFYASQLGSLFSAARSLYGHLIPLGDESKYYGLYELTDKGSSWIGPLMAAFIANAYDLRWALIYVLIFFAVAIPIVQFGVDYEEGMRQAGKLKVETAMSPASSIDIKKKSKTELVECETDAKA